MMALPLPKSEAEGGQGRGAFVTLVTQSMPPQHVLITTAADFQASGASAQPHAVLTMYDELIERKGIVLGRVDVVSRGVLTKRSAKTFVVSLAEMYLADERYAHVRRFNAEPDKFYFSAVLALFGCRL